MDTITATIPATTEITTVRRPSGFRRRMALTVAAMALAVGITGVMPTAKVAAAGGVATTYGMTCNDTYNWARNNFPKMTSTTGAVQNVYFKSDLYKWNGSSWVFYTSKGWFNGAANANGILSLAPGVTWIQMNTNGGTNSGVVFQNLPAGYYLTYEYYRWGSLSGPLAQQWSPAYCQLT